MSERSDADFIDHDAALARYKQAPAEAKNLDEKPLGPTDDNPYSSAASAKSVFYVGPEVLAELEKKMNAHEQRALVMTRRHFLRDLSTLLGQANPLASREPKAKSVIYLHMAGSPPHLHLFDYKPELVKHGAVPRPG